jgi:hypothetical protein
MANESISGKKTAGKQRTLVKATVYLIHLVSSKFSKPFLGQASQYLQPTKLIQRLNSLDHSVSQWNKLSFSCFSCLILRQLPAHHRQNSDPTPLQEGKIIVALEIKFITESCS